MPASRPSVLLTGVTGFVGAHVLDRLIDSDKYRIIAPVRSLNKVQHLRTKYHDQIDSEQLTFVEIPDLSVPHAFDSALKEYEVAYIIHLASPYFVTTTNPMEELVKPAVSAAHNVMESAITLGAPNLRRLTLLSSFASVVDLSKIPGQDTPTPKKIGIL